MCCGGLCFPKHKACLPTWVQAPLCSMAPTTPSHTQAWGCGRHSPPALPHFRLSCRSPSPSLQPGFTGFLHSRVFQMRLGMQEPPVRRCFQGIQGSVPTGGSVGATNVTKQCPEIPHSTQWVPRPVTPLEDSVGQAIGSTHSLSIIRRGD